MRNSSLDWSISSSDSVSSDPWMPPSFLNRSDDSSCVFNTVPCLQTLIPTRSMDGTISRADSIAFADQFRLISYNILLESEDPLSTSQLHSRIAMINPDIIGLLDQRKSTSCMAKLLSEDPKHRFSRFTSSVIKKANTYFGLASREYDSSSWIPKTDIAKPLDQSHKVDLETTEQIREYVRSVLMHRENKALTCFEIMQIMKEENPSMHGMVSSKSRNYIVKTLCRDPKKRFAIMKSESGSLYFSLVLSADKYL